jgi:hypothetical protein
MEQETAKTPSVVEAMRVVLQEDFDEEIEFNRVEIRITQGGEVLYRLWPRDGSDYVGGVASVR